MRGHGYSGVGALLFCICVSLSLASVTWAGEEASVSGTFTFNGEAVKLPYVYVVAEEKGFYEDDDPTWKLIFVDQPVEERELDGHIWDAALLELGITKTATFDDEPTLQVYSQNIVPAADYGGNISGGTYPELEMETTGPELFAGRVYQPEPRKLFDDTFQYDLTFSAPISNPDAPIGDPLPADGGEPGKAYLGWVGAIHGGNVDKLKAMVPAEMAAELDGGEDAKEMLELMQLMTPTDIKILGGSSDGETAILQVEGMMDGEKQSGEVTVQKMGDFWVPTNSSW